MGETDGCPLQSGCLWTQNLGLLAIEEVERSQWAKAECRGRVAGYALNRKMLEFPRIQVDTVGHLEGTLSETADSVTGCEVNLQKQELRE